jgi:BirA family biotin operon repressor/biotin-[acetyl-CoA-carboxylase] ligase
MPVNEDLESLSPDIFSGKEAWTTPSGRGWTIHHYAMAGSTNDICRSLPAWYAVRADTQSRGRGRFGRSFVSDPGGLWLSASLPAYPPRSHWDGFSLRVGASLLEYARSLGLPDVRLRWPNDLLCADSKLAGLLIEHPSTGVIVVGIGLNITNQPWIEAPELISSTTSLAAQMTSPPSIMEVMQGILEAITKGHQQMIDGGMATAINELNESWTKSRPVELTLSDSRIISGSFIGLDSMGHLRIQDASGNEIVIEHYLVQRLRELAT